jgi:hypothetical protein
VAGQLVDDRAELDSFGSGPEDSQHLEHAAILKPGVLRHSEPSFQPAA